MRAVVGRVGSYQPAQVDARSPVRGIPRRGMTPAAPSHARTVAVFALIFSFLVSIARHTFPESPL